MDPRRRGAGFMNIVIATEDWTPDAAERIARASGVTRLGERHWLAITLVRELHVREGRVPTLERICEISDLTPAELSRLFGQAERQLPEIAGIRPYERSIR